MTPELLWSLKSCGVCRLCIGVLNDVALHLRDTAMTDPTRQNSCSWRGRNRFRLPLMLDLYRRLKGSLLTSCIPVNALRIKDRRGHHDTVPTGKLLLPALAFLVFLALSFPLGAYAWPTAAQWTPVLQNGVYLQDPLGDAQGPRDVVGNAIYPAAYIFNDGDYIHFRLRLDGDPTGTGQSLLRPFSWGVLLNTNQNPGTYEWMIMVDGMAKPEVITLWQNTVQGTLGDPSDRPEILHASVPVAGNYRITLADSTFGGNADYFLDWRFPYATLKNATGLTDSSPIQFFFGTSSHSNSISGDLVGGSDLYSGFSDVVTLVGTTPTTGEVSFVADLAGNGDVTQIFAGDTIYIRVDDNDLNYNNATLQTVTVTLIATSGDTAQVTLTETGVDTGIFTGSIPTEQGFPLAGDGILQVMPGDTVNVEYIDGIDALNNTNQIRADSLWVVALEPVISLVKSADPETAAPGGEVIYSISYHNLGQGAASNLVIVDAIPFFTTYVTGSMRIGDAESTYDTATPLTDEADGDGGHLSGNSVIFTISSVAADDGVAGSGSDEGKVYFKVAID